MVLFRKPTLRPQILLVRCCGGVQNLDGFVTLMERVLVRNFFVSAISDLKRSDTIRG